MTDQNPKNPLFELGQIVATHGAIEALQQAHISADNLLARHQCGDWGELEDEDLASNNAALHQDLRIFSCYRINETTRIWVITEADRSATTLLLPEEY